MGLDAASVGSTTIDRAVRLRMASLGLERREDYWQQLQDSTDELQELVEAVVVPETWFFRDREAFAALVRLVTEEWLPAHPTRHPALAERSLLHGRRALFDGHGALGRGILAWSGFRWMRWISARRALAQAKRGVYGMNSFRGENLGFRERYFRPTAEWLRAGRMGLRKGEFSPGQSPLRRIFASAKNCTMSFFAGTS